MVLRTGLSLYKQDPLSESLVVQVSLSKIPSFLTTNPFPHPTGDSLPGLSIGRPFAPFVLPNFFQRLPYRFPPPVQSI